jgi:hypothetical protein
MEKRIAALVALGDDPFICVVLDYRASESTLGVGSDVYLDDLPRAQEVLRAAVRVSRRASECRAGVRRGALGICNVISTFNL